MKKLIYSAPRVSFYFAAILFASTFFACSGPEVTPSKDNSLAKSVLSTNVTSTPAIIFKRYKYKISSLDRGGEGEIFNGDFTINTQVDSAGNFITIKGGNVFLNSITYAPVLDYQISTSSKVGVKNSSTTLSITFRLPSGYIVAFNGKGTLETGYKGNIWGQIKWSPVPLIGTFVLTPVL